MIPARTRFCRSMARTIFLPRPPRRPDVVVASRTPSSPSPRRLKPGASERWSLGPIQSRPRSGASVNYRARQRLDPAGLSARTLVLFRAYAAHERDQRQDRDEHQRDQQKSSTYAMDCACSTVLRYSMASARRFAVTCRRPGSRGVDLKLMLRQAHAERLHRELQREVS